MINENDYKKVGIIFPEGSYDHTLCMKYTKKYLQDLISDLGYDLDFIEKDKDYEDFDNNQLEEFQLPSSKAIAGCQIHGNLIMDWLISSPQQIGSSKLKIIFVTTNN